MMPIKYHTKFSFSNPLENNYYFFLLFDRKKKLGVSPIKKMIIYSLLFLLLSNAVTSRREKSILYSRETILIMLFSSLIALNNLDVPFLNEGLGLYGGLFHATPITQTFHIFIFFVSAVILQLTAFYPRKI